MRARIILLTASSALVVSACAGTAGSSSAGVAAGPQGNGAMQPAVAAPESLPAPASAVSSTAADGVQVGAPNGEIERSVTASYTVPQGSFLQDFQSVTVRGVQLGGYVVSSQTFPNASGRIVSGSLTSKIPAAQLANFLNGMPSDFSASAIDFGSVDHTADYVNVNARLASANAHLLALQHLLANATSLDDITTLEQQIESVQEEVDTDQGQLNLLTDEVTYATATVRLAERGAVAAAPAPPVSNGISNGWNNALSVSGVIVEVLLTAIPVLLLAAILGALWWVFGRRVLRPRNVS